jgi:hypothetical protein
MWIAAGKLKPIEPEFLFYMIWATTQQYANAAHKMATLNRGRRSTTRPLNVRKQKKSRSSSSRSRRRVSLPKSDARIGFVPPKSDSQSVLVLQAAGIILSSYYAVEG